MHVLGTAGHVDHGKSTLVRALTGMDPDRLQEEKDRQLSIDLGFAWVTLPGGEEVGIVDVPGHRDFIENMLAGVGGIDAALLVVAADEGVMPQTREHVAILDLLEVRRGLVALSKIDIMPDEEWLLLAEEEIRGLLEGTSLEGAEITRVSGKTETGVPELTSALGELLEETPERVDVGRPRLPIDRSFSVAGFGTIVTGTLLDGTLRVGEEVVLLPSGLEVRVRGLQTHKEDVEIARPGSRVAVNLSGVDTGSITRGEVLTRPGADQASEMIDVSVRLLPGSPTTIAHNQEVKLFLGAAQRIARVRLLGREELYPGEEGWLQLLVPEPVVARRGDKYILRRPSPPITIGGGQVADPNPSRKHPLRDRELPHRLDRLLRGQPNEVLLEVVRTEGPAPWDRLLATSELSMEEAEEALQDLLAEDEVVRLSVAKGGGELLMARTSWEEKTATADRILTAYHEEQPLRSEMPQEELRSRLRLEPAVFGALLERWIEKGRLRASTGGVALGDFQVSLSEEQAEQVKKLEEAFLTSPYGPPSVKEALGQIPPELYHHLLDRGTLVQVSQDVVFHERAYEEMVKEIRERLANGDRIEVGEVRDLFDTSRKYALALMEHLDDIGVTVREGDERRLA